MGSDEWKRRISAGCRAHAYPKRDEEFKAKISAIKSGVSPSEETRNKIRAALIGRPGHPHTEDSRSKIGEAQRGVPRSEAAKEAVAVANRTRGENHWKTLEEAGVAKGLRYVHGVFSHRRVYEQHFGPIPAGYVVHHRDGNKLNNDPTNLVAMSRAAHNRLHWAARSEIEE